MKRYIKSSLINKDLSIEQAIRRLEFLRHDYCGEQAKEVLTFAIDTLQNPSGTDINTNMTIPEIVHILEFMRDNNPDSYDRAALNMAIDAIN